MVGLGVVLATDTGWCNMPPSYLSIVSGLRQIVVPFTSGEAGRHPQSPDRHPEREEGPLLPASSCANTIPA